MRPSSQKRPQTFDDWFLRPPACDCYASVAKVAPIKSGDLVGPDSSEEADRKIRSDFRMNLHRLRQQLFGLFYGEHLNFATSGLMEINSRDRILGQPASAD